MVRVDDVAPATTFEYMECTAVAGTVLTVTRGQEGTTGIAHNAGAIVGNDMTAAMLIRSFPLGWLGDAEVTANQAAITTQADLTGLTVTVTVGTSRKIRLSALVRYTDTIANDQGQLFIMEGATQLAIATIDLVNNTRQYSVTCEVILSAPSSGSHTYKLQGARGGTGSMTMQAAATSPAFLLCEDLGAI
jgi:hypothetical protein